MKPTRYNKRLVAWLTLEATTPLAISSGAQDIITDAPVLLDVNGLPYIPGTTLAGVIRHSLDEKTADIFGRQSKNSKDSFGSEIIFSEARMIGHDGEVIDGIQEINWRHPFYVLFRNLPIRQHVRINSRGVAEKSGKFDQQVVYKGTRFCCEIELVTDGENEEKFEKVLNVFSEPSTRFGSGSRKGFGELQVVEMRYQKFNLRNPDELESYLAKSSRLNSYSKEIAPTYPSRKRTDWTEYKLTLRPDDFFLFSSGFGNDKADITPVEESFIEWKEGKPSFVNNATLLPATSIKGAIAHRVTYHWNLLNHRYASIRQKNINKDEKGAAEILFGTANDKECIRGNVIFSDIIVKDSSIATVLDHVAIDRFTGGTMEGALFQEETLYAKGNTYTMSIFVDEEKINNEKVMKAFESTLDDICKGLLPLGGGNSRGNGLFTGQYEKIKNNG